MSADYVSEPSGGPYFFLSYAHTPKHDRDDPLDPDRWVFQLYKDLCEHIISLSTIRPESAGFMDREMRPGTDWPRRVSQALGNCRVFVPLYSPRYFLSESCGKEWFAFAKRSVDFGTRRGQVVDAIVPALWVTVHPEKLPRVARSIQFDHQILGTRYSEEGFYGIIKLDRYRDEYQEAVYRLAQRIIDVANHTQVASAPPGDFKSLQSPFGSNDSGRLADQRIHITVAAPDKQNLPAGRSEGFYGATSRDWNPYPDESAESIADYTAQLTRCLGFEPSVHMLADHAGDPSAAIPPSGPCLLLVDPWESATIAHQERLRMLDEQAKPYVSLMVPWSNKDIETMNAHERLRSTLSQSLSRLRSEVPSDQRIAGTGIPTLKMFGNLVPPLACHAGRAYLREAPAYPPAGPHIEKPRLNGPYFGEPGDSS